MKVNLRTFTFQCILFNAGGTIVIDWFPVIIYFWAENCCISCDILRKLRECRDEPLPLSPPVVLPDVDLDLPEGLPLPGLRSIAFGDFVQECGH